LEYAGLNPSAIALGLMRIDLEIGDLPDNL
jgi:hypothetical protein